MKHERIYLHEKKAYLDTYFQEMSAELKLSVQRPCILICPGGGYQMTTDREAEPIALAFLARGFQTAILRYPVAPSRFPESLFCLAEAVAWLRTHAEENRIDPMQITVCGFSAGGHLAAGLGVFWNQDAMWEETGLALANELTMDSAGGVICKSCEGWLELACAWLNRPVKAYIRREETPV